MCSKIKLSFENYNNYCRTILNVLQVIKPNGLGTDLDIFLRITQPLQDCIEVLITALYSLLTLF